MTDQGGSSTAVPDFQSIVLPLLDLAADGQEHSLREAIETLAEKDWLGLDFVHSGQTQRVSENPLGLGRGHRDKPKPTGIRPILPHLQPGERQAEPLF